MATLTTDSQEWIAQGNRDLQLAVVLAQTEAQLEVERIKAESQRHLEREKTLREDQRTQVEPYREYVNRAMRRYRTIHLALVNQQEEMLRNAWEEMRNDDLTVSDLRDGEVGWGPFHEAGDRFQDLDNTWRLRLMANLNRNQRQAGIADFVRSFEPLLDAANALNKAATGYIFSKVECWPSCRQRVHRTKVPASTRRS